MKINELDSIRGLASLLIVFIHIPIWNSILENGLIRNSYLMVELFFVLSGYVIYSAYSKKINNVTQLMRFQFLRFGRLFPVHFLFLILYLFVELARYVSVMKFDVIVDVPPFEKSNVVAFLEHLFLFQALGGHHDSYNVPAWSISVEFYTYLLFAALVLLTRNFKDWIFLGIFLLSCILLITETYGASVLLIRCTAGFFLGCLTSKFTLNSRISLHPYVSFLSFASIVIFLAIKPLYKFDVAIYFLTAILIFTLVKSRHGLLNTILNWSILIWLGRISYSVYMSHYLIIRVFDFILRRILNKPLNVGINGSVEVQLTIFETIVSCFLLVLIIMFISNLVYKFLEDPMRQRSREFIF